MELLDIVDEKGNPTGETVPREVAHREGIRHRTAHVWIFRRRGGVVQILLQKRCDNKDSDPGCYDISSAGHIMAGDEPLPAAVREMEEELGLTVKAEDLTFIGVHHGAFEAEFYGKMFRDNELSSVYLYTEPVEIKDLTLQESEVEEVIWMDYEECRKQVESGELANCIYLDEFRMVGEYLQSRSGQRIERLT